MLTPARGSPREIFPLGRLFSHRSASMNAAGPHRCDSGRAMSLRRRRSKLIELPGDEILEILRSSRFVRGETKSNFS